MLKQVAIFAANNKGAMRRITETLFKADVNIMGSVTNDSAEYGIIRMVVSDAVRAEEALNAAGYTCKLVDVLAVEVEDEPGNLNRLLATLDESNVNINYIYLSFNRDSGKPIMVLHTPDILEVEECLRMKGYTLL